MQGRRNSIANTLELRLSCTNPSIQRKYFFWLIHVSSFEQIVLNEMYCYCPIKIITYHQTVDSNKSMRGNKTEIAGCQKRWKNTYVLLQVFCPWSVDLPWGQYTWCVPFKHCIMMTSSNGNIFRVTGHLCGEFTGLRWIPRTKASDAELWCFLWCPSN